MARAGRLALVGRLKRQQVGMGLLVASPCSGCCRLGGRCNNEAGGLVGGRCLCAEEWEALLAEGMGDRRMALRLCPWARGDDGIELGLVVG